MRKYGEYSELKKTILMTMAYTMDKSSLHELGDMFAVLDSSNTGTVTLADLKQSLRQVRSDKHMEDETIEKLFHGIDVDSSGDHPPATAASHSSHPLIYKMLPH